MEDPECSVLHPVEREEGRRPGRRSTVCGPLEQFVPVVEVPEHEEDEETVREVSQSAEEEVGGPVSQIRQRVTHLTPLT